MLRYKDNVFLKSSFRNEQELEDVVVENCQLLFGPESFFLPKSLIKTSDGAGTIPDGFVIDLENGRWFVVEAELLHHGVWAHIVPQITKQLVAIKNSTTKIALEDMVVKMVEADSLLGEKFKSQGIEVIHIRKALRELLDAPPSIAIPIDEISKDLTIWADNLKYEVFIWKIERFVHEKNSSEIVYLLPDEFSPSYSSPSESMLGQELSNRQRFQVKLIDLVDAGLLSNEDVLTLSYTPRGGKRKTYTATVSDRGTLIVLDQEFESVSNAAMACIQHTGSSRETVNGWTSWTAANGKRIDELRREFISDAHLPQIE